jgi:Holliday junction resolvase RusA-like endonuclease
MAGITIVLLGEPCAWRHRTSRTYHRYLPEKQRDIAAVLRLSASEKMDLLCQPPFTGPIRLTMVAEVSVPDSWSNKKRTAALTGALLPIKRPDCSNYLKLAEDCLSKIVFKDDCQIVELQCKKIYSAQPKITVTVEPINGSV